MKTIATVIEVANCRGAKECKITDSPPTIIQKDPNSGVLLIWDEKQNITLKEDLAVDRVFDSSASFVKKTDNGYVIKAGTIVSSHYVQWDPGKGSRKTVKAKIIADSKIFAFITEDEKLFSTDKLLGLDNLEYNDFLLRSLEKGDKTKFSGKGVQIKWYATSPGDWTRLITAYSPHADEDTPSVSTMVDKLLSDGWFDLDIAFEFDSSSLTQKGREQLDQFVEAANRLPLEKRRFLFIGHTDGKGDEDYNLKLSLQRVNTVKQYLVTQRNFKPSKLETRGMGEQKLKLPRHPNDARNRRVEVRLQ